VPTPTDIAREWVNAYVEGRDEDLVALAHEEIVVRPRRGQGESEYHGIDGVRRWLQHVGKPPPPFRLGTVEPLDEERVLVEGTIDDVGVVAVFVVRDTKMAAVSTYVSDREMLERLGLI
jgi:SnoaL-like protein